MTYGGSLKQELELAKLRKTSGVLINLVYLGNGSIYTNGFYVDIPATLVSRMSTREQAIRWEGLKLSLVILY